MRQCPLCNRLYDADTAYCLEDGSLLNNAREPEKTLIRPARKVVPTETETAWRYKVVETPKQRRGWRVVVAAVLAVIFAGIGVALLIFNIK